MIAMFVCKRGEGMVVSPPHAAVTIPRFFWGNIWDNSIVVHDIPFPKDFFTLILRIFFYLTTCGLTVGVGQKPQEAIWNAECNIRWGLHCSCPHICAPQSELIWFSPLPLPSLSPKPGSNKNSPFILVSLSFCPLAAIDTFTIE